MLYIKNKIFLSQGNPEVFMGKKGALFAESPGGGEKGVRFASVF
jgi:hypothetical protein